MPIRPLPVALGVLLLVGVARPEEPATLARVDALHLQAAGLKADPAVLLSLVRPAGPEAVARIPRLVAELDHDDYDRRRIAADELVRLGRPARAALLNLPAEASVDVRRQAGLLVEAIDNRLAPATTLAVLRTLCRQGHPEAAGLVLEYLPTFLTATGYDLVASLLRTDPTHQAADAALRRALADPEPMRRIAAGIVLARRGTANQAEAAAALLGDADESVRLRTAQGFLGRADERGIAPLVGLLTGSIDRAWQAEELLRWAAGPGAPSELLSKDDPAVRKACRAAWEKWLASPVRAIDWAALRNGPRRPALYLTCRQERVELVGGDGVVRWSVETTRGGSFVDAQLLPGGRVVAFDDNETELCQFDAAGKVAWKWKAPNGEIAVAVHPFPNEGRFLVVTDEQLHEVDHAGKHLRSLRLGDKYFSDACPIDAARLLALTDEGFFLVDRASGRLIREIRVAQTEDLFDSGRLVPLPEGLVAIDSRLLDRILVVDVSGQVQETGPPSKPRPVWGLARFRSGNWVLGGPAPMNRFAEQRSDGRVVGEVVLPPQRPTRFRLALEEVRLGLDDDPAAPFSVDSAEYRIAALKDGGAEERRRAATVLGQYRDQADRVIPALVAALDTDDAALHTSATRSLSQLGPVALPALRRLLKDGRPTARAQAALGVGWMGAAGVPAVPDLVALLADAATPGPLRIACCEGLTALGPAAGAATAALRNALTDPEPALRRVAAAALGTVGRGEPENVAALIAALADKNENVAVTAALHLGKYGPKAKDAVPPLVRLLERPAGTAGKPPHPFALRQQAVQSLGEIGPAAAEAVPALVALVADAAEEMELRTPAVRTLGRFGAAAKDALPALRDALLVPDKHQGLQQEALRSLALLRQVGGITAMLDAARNGTENVRYAAVTALGGLGVDGQVALPVLKELNTNEKIARVRTAIQRAIRRIPTPPVA